MPLYQSGVSDVGVESSTPALSWGPVIGGAVAAGATALILLLLGAGVGLTMVSPWAGESASFTTVSITAAIWFVVVQWLASALGGYLTGRLRTKWAGVHSDEVFFRDTAHGFLSWALATVVVAGLAGSAFTSLVGGSVQALASATSSAAIVGATSASVDKSGPDVATGYFTDALLRRQDLRNRAQTDDAAAVAEVSRILLNSATAGSMPDEDKTYLSAVVSSRTGLTPEEATARVDSVLQRIDQAKVETQEAADKARRSASTAAMLGALSLLVGAFIASAAAALGGRQRDDEEAAFIAKF
ncbi:hypothetical protein JNB91_23230 [Rhizobium wenxiniae]|uniref:hypothetical protein n=1 Tax=Rhizobium wenxiniae TaxID=1737357 RepID=UPI001C6E796C|nr:hypothetical protein [Rhizobium wenxiniae]MBW9090733.1 hypothetical protein [Rhizobium wenxiniae]